MCHNFVSGVTSAVGDEIDLKIDPHIDAGVPVRIRRAVPAVPTRLEDGGQDQDQDHGGEKKDVGSGRCHGVIMNVMVVVGVAGSRTVMLRFGAMVLWGLHTPFHTGMNLGMGMIGHMVLVAAAVASRSLCQEGDRPTGGEMQRSIFVL